MKGSVKGEVAVVVREGALVIKIQITISNKNNYQKWCFAFIFESFLLFHLSKMYTETAKISIKRYFDF